MKNFVLFLLIFSSLALNAATVTWDGDVDNDWNNPMNWVGDVLPGASDDADLNGATVVLTASTTVLRVFAGGTSNFTINPNVTLTLTGLSDIDVFKVEGDASVTNDGTISITNVTTTLTTDDSGVDGIVIKGENVSFTNNGTIAVDGIPQTGVWAQGGTFTNNGTITATNFGQHWTDGDGIYADDFDNTDGTGCNFTNTGTITITTTSGDEAININDGGTINNTSMITIADATGGDAGIRIDDRGIFNNLAGATFNIGSTVDDQIRLDNDDVEFNNAGTLNMTNAQDIGLYITDACTFTNTNIVNISGASNYSIQMDANSMTATIENSGTLTITGGSHDGIRLQEGATFNNNVGGVLNIDTPLSEREGIKIEASGGTINNSGAISITGAGANLNTGDNGLEMAAGVFNNLVDGILTITNTFDDGIFMRDGATFDNNGTVDLSNTVDKGLDMRGGVFNNNDGALFQAIDCATDNIDIQMTAAINNDGVMILNKTVDGSGRDDIEVNSPATFTNTANAVFAPGSSPGELEIRGAFDLGTSTTNFEITGTSAEVEYDRLNKADGSSTMTVTNATAHLDWGTFVPNVGNTFKIIDGSGLVIGEFATVTSSNPSIMYTVDYTSNTEEVAIVVDAVLPVGLTYFEGRVEKATNLLNWETQAELNNDYFEIEHSTDGRDFSMLDKVNGNGTSTTINKYEYIHKNPANGDNYYRLKQVDFNGNFEYSNIVYLQDKVSDTPTAIYPNPAQDALNYEGAAATLTFYDIYGKQVMQRIRAEENTSLDISELGVGIYIIEISSQADEKTFQRFIKK